MITKKLPIKDIKQRARAMLERVDAGVYDKPADVGFSIKYARWCFMGVQFTQDALHACGLDNHPQAGRVLELLHNNPAAFLPDERMSGHQHFFRLMLDMASLIHNTRQLGYNSKTGRYC